MNFYFTEFLVPFFSSTLFLTHAQVHSHTHLVNVYVVYLIRTMARFFTALRQEGVGLPYTGLAFSTGRLKPSAIALTFTWKAHYTPRAET